MKESPFQLFRPLMAVLLLFLLIAWWPSVADAAAMDTPVVGKMVDQVLDLPLSRFEQSIKKLTPTQRNLVRQRFHSGSFQKKFKNLPLDKQRLFLKAFPSLAGSAPSAAAESTATATLPETGLRLPPEVMEKNRTRQRAERTMRRAIADSFTSEPTLEQFGYDLFDRAGNTFKPDTLVSVPMDYILGPGDTFTIFFKGKEHREHTLMIDREGMIPLPGVGHIPVAGLRFQSFKEMLRNEIKERLIGTELGHVALGALRTIQVFVLGNVDKPGFVTVSALSTMTHTLLLSGGIQPIGSLRNIQLKRRGELVNTLDLYRLLLHGDNRDDIRIQDGDVIFVPPIGATISIDGAVKRPAIYELLHEGTVEEALAMAGGLLPAANPGKVKLERIDRRENRRLLDIDITKPEHLKTPVQSGDTITVGTIIDRQEGIIRVKGHVDIEETFQWRSGIRLLDVLPPGNRLKPETDLAYTLISRINPRDGTTTTLTVRLDRAMADPSSRDNPRLKPEDTVILFSRSRTQLIKRRNSLTEVVKKLHEQARFNEVEQLVTLGGHVRFPGIYPYSPGMGVRDLIRAAGDLQPNADMDYALVVRTMKDGRIEPLSIRPGHILRQSGRSGGFTLKPRDHVLVFKADALPRDLFRKFDLDSLRSGPEKPSPEWENPFEPDREKAEPGEVEKEIPLLKRSRVIKKEYFLQEGLVDLKNRKGPEAATERNSLTLKRSNRIIEVQPDETVERKELLAPVLAKLREQSTNTHPARVVLITGAVRFPGEYPLERNMRVSDLIRAGGKLAEPAYTLDAALTRFEVVHDRHREIDHTKVDLEKILKGDPGSDLVLKPHDVLQIKQIPRWGKINRVFVSGELRFPGTYPIKNGETLAGLIERAGGLSPLAFPEGAIFLRKSLKKREYKEMNDLAKRLKIQLAQEESKPPSGEGASRVNTGLLHGLINQLTSTEPQGRLAIDLPEILASAARNRPYTRIILRDGDSLIIPQRSNEVTVLGEVYYPASHQHKSALDLEAYINLSGGYGQAADRERVYVVKANGQVMPRDPKPSPFGSSWFTGVRPVPVNPGDTIVIPMKVETMAPMTYWKDISQVMSNISVTVATLNTLGAL